MSVAIATSLYPQAACYFADWIRGVEQAAEMRRDVEAVVALDCIDDADTLLAPLARRMPVHAVAARRGAGIAEVRRTMIAATVASGADCIVFCDSDDVLLPAALGVHGRNLQHADISVADLMPVDADLVPIADAMLADDLPAEVDADTLIATNVMGFSNTAARRDVLAGLLDAHPAFPAEIVAVDWWMFDALLAVGATVKSARVPVAAYRQHAANTLGATGAVDERAARQRLSAFVRHMTHATSSPARAILRREAERLLADKDALRCAMAHAPRFGRAWFADAATWTMAARTGAH